MKKGLEKSAAPRYSQPTRKTAKRKRGKKRCGEAADAGGLTPTKDNNDAAVLFSR